MRRLPWTLALTALAATLLALSFMRDRGLGPAWLVHWPVPSERPFVHSPCNIPIHFALGEVDPRFGFDALTMMLALVEATNLWQAAHEELLFIESDHPRAMQVSLAFDERQQAARTRRSLRGGLERDGQALKADEALLRAWGERIELARTEHERASRFLEERVRRHERDVSGWRSSPAGPPEKQRLALEAERDALRLALDNLERIGNELNADIRAYNRRAENMRRRAEDFQERLGRYNATSLGDEIESGRYSFDPVDGRRIEVFRAESADELVWIFAHELGHALGIGHVPDPDAVMHALLHEERGSPAGRTRPVSLGAADRAALRAVCGD
jgi:hypothetical protein